MAEPGPICNIQVLKYWPEATAMRIGTLSMIGKMVAHSGESKKALRHIRFTNPVGH